MTVGLPIGLMLTLGLAVALLIAKGQWMFATVIVIAVPMAIVFLRYPFVAVIIWLLVVPFIQTTPTYASRYIFWLIHRAMIPLALAVTIISSWINRDKYRLPSLGRAELAAIAFMSLAVIWTLWERVTVTAKLILLYDRTFIPFLTYLLIQFTAPRDKDLKRLMPILWIVCVAECVIGIMSWYVPSLLPPAWLYFQGWRTSGTLDEPASYTIALVFCMLPLLQYSMHHRSNALRRLLLFTFGLGAGCVFLSFSRGSWLAGSLVGLVLLALYPKTMLRLCMGILIFVIILSISTGLVAPYSTWASERLEDKDTADARLGEAYASLRMIQARPFFGWGYENFDRYDNQFLTTEARGLLGNWDSTSHNTYLTIMAELGLVGFFLFIFPYFWWLFLTLKVLHRMPREGFWSWRLPILLWLTILFYVLVSSFIDMRFFNFSLTLPWLSLGLIAHIVRAYLQPGDIGAPAWAIRPVRSDSWLIDEDVDL